MSGVSSSAAAWSTRLEPGPLREDILQRPDDPKLGQFIKRWDGNPAALTPGRAVLVGFPQDEGIRRNHGRVGAAQAPNAIRSYLARLSPWDPLTDTGLVRVPPLDLGNVRITGTLEDTQAALGEVVAAVLRSGAVPVILGGGHETAYGHYLGYVAAGMPVGIINLDAHLDVRPVADHRGHSGSPFRQAMEHVRHPLPGKRYICLGAQPHAAARDHVRYAQEKGCVICWADEVERSLTDRMTVECDRLASEQCHVAVSLDADVVHVADMPAVSAPNSRGISGREVLTCVRHAGTRPQVTSFDLVEVCPPLDRDGQGTRWAALAVWHFLGGLAERTNSDAPTK
jgi:formiminoglutamase